MLQHIIWIICFFSLWLILVWLQFLFFDNNKAKKNSKMYHVTVCVPAYNEEKTVARTVKSIVDSDYPKEMMEIMVVNDGSTDNTSKAAKKLIKKYKDYDIKVIDKKNGGKAAALNTALETAKGELFAVVDADSIIDRKGIMMVTRYFSEKNTAGVMSRTRVENPKNICEKMQRFEYIMSGMLRSVMSRIGTLAITPGVLSIYRTKVLKKVGGFTRDKDNMTEDLEIAMRLRYHHYDVLMEPESITHTKVPPKLKGLWKQRLRWSRGFVYNHWNYRSMFMSKKHGFYGMFQMPVSVLAVSLAVLNVSIIAYTILSDFLETIIRTFTIRGYFMTKMLDFPTMKAMILGQNVRVAFPIMITAVLGFLMIFIAHKKFKENVFENIAGVVSYFVFIPYFTTANWITSFAKEIRRSKRKW